MFISSQRLANDHFEFSDQMLNGLSCMEKKPENSAQLTIVDRL